MKDFNELKKNVSAMYFSVYSVKNEKIIYDKDGEIECFPASTTKVLNALVAFKYLKLDDVLTIGEEQDVMHYSHDPSVAGIKKGERWTFRDILYASLLPSGNDAAYAIAYNAVERIPEYKDKSVEEKCHIYVDMMNAYAKELGCKSTHFCTPDGNDHYKGKIVLHVTTTNDLCLIFREALKCEGLMKAMSTPEIRVMVDGNEYHFKNTNRLIRPDSEFYNEYVLGGKTGTTELAGCCITSMAKKEDDIYIVSVCYSETGADRFKDSNMIYDFLFNGDK